MAADALIELEERGWRALATDPRTASEFYEQVLDEDVVMLLPGGMRVTERTHRSSSSTTPSPSSRTGSSHSGTVPRPTPR